MCLHPLSFFSPLSIFVLLTPCFHPFVFLQIQAVQSSSQPTVMKANINLPLPMRSTAHTNFYNKACDLHVSVWHACSLFQCADSVQGAFDPRMMEALQGQAGGVDFEQSLKEMNMTPEEVMQKIMSDPELAVVSQNQQQWLLTLPMPNACTFAVSSNIYMLCQCLVCTSAWTRTR